MYEPVDRVEMVISKAGAIPFRRPWAIATLRGQDSAAAMQIWETVETREHCIVVRPANIRSVTLCYMHLSTGASCILI